jgi:aminopeptidase N
LLDGNGQELDTKLAGESAAMQGTRVLLADSAETTFTFEDVASPPVPSLFRGFSAPIKMSGITPEQSRFLAAHDTDPFVRWDSGQQYATRVLLDLIPAWNRGETLTVDPGLIEAMSETLAQSDKDPAFVAEAMYLPGEAFLADQMEIADVDAIHAVRDIARIAIGDALQERLRATYDRYTDAGPYSIDGAAIGKRSLRNACLSYLSAGGDPSLAKRQFDTAGNMTDSLAALGVLSSIDCPERDAALTAFHAKWHDDPLVLDKWFSIQAMSSLPNTIEHVRALSRHPDFDLRNPNRIRALVGAFASANQVRFHDANGEGYRFLADIVIALDPANPQVAARIVGPLGQWRRMDGHRQALMQAELKRIVALPGLSKNTYEVVSKSLDH